MSEERKPLPELGSTEAAVSSVVNLISVATGKDQDLLAYWLDLYYQVRTFHEGSTAIAELNRRAAADPCSTSDRSSSGWPAG